MPFLHSKGKLPSPCTATSMIVELRGPAWGVGKLQMPE